MKFNTFFSFSLFLFGFWGFSSATLAADFTSAVYEGRYKTLALDTEHFTLEFSDAIEAGADSDGDGFADLIEEIAEYAEFSWDKEVDELGFPSPLVEQERVVLILDDVDEYAVDNTLGVTSIFEDGTIYIAIDSSLSSDLLQVTIAHEFLHVIQFSYMGFFIGYNQDLFFAESTAVWVEEAVYADVNDYLSYLTEFFDFPEYSVFTGERPEDHYFEYGLVAWPLFLSQYFENASLIRDVINSYFNDTKADLWDAYQAYQSVLEQSYAEDIRQVYQVFALWNYIPTYYTDGAQFPKVSIEKSYPSQDLPLTGSIDEKNAPALFGSNYLQFKVPVSTTDQSFSFTLNKPKDVEFSVVLLPESDDTYFVSKVSLAIVAAEQEQEVFEFPLESNFSQFTVIVSPLSSDPQALESEEEAFVTRYPYSYEVAVVAKSSNESTEGEDEFQDPTEVELEEEILEDTSLNVEGLKVTGETNQSVSLQWSRNFDEDVAGYKVYYGTESGQYTEVYTLDKPHIVRATIENLLPLSAYYFVVTAYAEDGKEGADYEEVSATLELRKFSDVPSSNHYYYSVHYLTYLGIIQGYEDSTFKPTSSINRAELMKILVGGALGEEPDSDLYKNCFPDVKTQWFAPYVCFAHAQGWVQGYQDGLFHPENTVTKAESLKMILTAFGVEIPKSISVDELPFDDVYGSSWYAPYVAVAYERGLLEENGTRFEPNTFRDRGEIAEEIFRELMAQLTEEGRYTEEILNELMAEWAEVL